MRAPLLIALLIMASIPLFAEESPPNAPASDSPQDVWTRAIRDRSERGTLHNGFQYVRGDSGKWNDDPLLLLAPSVRHKPEKTSLDDWFDELLDGEAFQASSGDDTWLLFRTRQLDDNDRVWVERVERQGNRFTIVLNEAIWQGRYSKTFTYYSVFGVNLGKLPPGDYEAQWIIQPLAFEQFDGSGRPQDNWPKDEREAEKQVVTLRKTFRVVAESGTGGDR